MIGVGIFRVPAEVAKYLPSASSILFAWILGGFITLSGVLTYAELSSRHPKTGGTYIFLREAFGSLIAFLYGWMEIFILRAGSLAAVAYILSAYLKRFILISPEMEKIVALAAIAFFTLLNGLGIQYGKGVQSFLSVLKILTLVGMSAAILMAENTGGAFLNSLSAEGMLGASLGPAMIAILFSYGGWHESTFTAGEYQGSARSLAYSLLTGAGVITFLYLLANVAYLWAMSPSEIAKSDAVASEILSRLYGANAEKIMTLAVLISAAGALNSTILTGARIPFALAQDLEKLNWLGKIHHRFETPFYSLLLNGFWASLLVLWGNFERLLFFCGFAKWFFFSLSAASIFFIRQRPRDTKHEIFSWGYPAAPILFLLFSIWLCWSVLAHAPFEAFIGTLIVISGIPLYYVLRRKN